MLADSPKIGFVAQIMKSDSSEFLDTLVTLKVWLVKTYSLKHTVLAHAKRLERSTLSVITSFLKRDSSLKIHLNIDLKISEGSLTSHSWSQERTMMTTLDLSTTLTSKRRQKC